MPKVSVIIPTYNYARFVSEAVQSVLDQSFQDMEVIVIDDGSTDDTREIIKRLGDKIRYIYQENAGLPAARNTGIRAARGEYVAFLDSDDLWLPEKLKLQVALLESSPKTGLVYCDALFFDHETGAILGAFQEQFAHFSGKVLKELLFQNFIPSPTPLVRRAVLDRVGLFDEALRACEDWDLWIRIAKVHEIGYVDRPLAKYRVHSGSMHKDPERMKRNQLTVLDKFFAEPDLPGQLLALRRQAYSQVHTHIGLVYFSQDEFDLAWENLFQAVKAYPRLLLDCRVTPFFIASLFGPKFAQASRAWKHKLFSRPPRPSPSTRERRNV